MQISEPILYIGILFFSLVPYAMSASLCPDGSWYFTKSGICYWLQTVPASATGSNAYCGLNGGTLAVFPTWEEYNWIVYTIAPTNIAPLISGPFWIGMTDAATEGTYISFDGSPTTYTVWDSSSPTDDGTMNKDCVYIDTNNNYNMFDESCSVLLPGLCSKTLGFCPPGSYYIADKLVCYWRTNVDASAITGNSSCIAAGSSGSLAVILDAQVNTALSSPPINALFSGLSSDIYIGVTDVETETVYKSYTGVPISWFNWDVGNSEPNDPGVPFLPSQDCVKMNPTSLLWQDVSCTSVYKALCYRDLSAFAAVTVVITAPPTPETTTSPTPGLTTIAETTTSDLPTTTTETTTEQSQVSTTPSSNNPSIPNTGECECPCEGQTLTPAEIEKVIEEIKKKLTVDVKTTSAYIRTKKSIYESRPAAQNIGVMGVVILCVVFGSIIIMDIGTLFKQIKNCGKAPV